MEYLILLIAFTLTCSLLFCLKIKSTKKTPELLGTVGTVKPLEDSENPPSFKVKTSPRLRPVSTISDVIHDESNRTPSRAGERKLPDIPQDNHEGSDLYATLGSALANRYFAQLIID